MQRPAEHVPSGRRPAAPVTSTAAPGPDGVCERPAARDPGEGRPDQRRQALRTGRPADRSELAAVLLESVALGAACLVCDAVVT
jgi:hypothetical protein